MYCVYWMWDSNYGICVKYLNKTQIFTVHLSNHVARVRIQVPIDAKMAPESQLLVYYIRDDQETVADQIKFTVNKCFNNQVFHWI